MRMASEQQKPTVEAHAARSAVAPLLASRASRQRRGEPPGDRAQANGSSLVTPPGRAFTAVWKLGQAFASASPVRVA